MWTTTRRQGAGRPSPSCGSPQWRNTPLSAVCRRNGRRNARRKHLVSTTWTSPFAALCTSSASTKSPCCTPPRFPPTTVRRQCTILRHRSTSARGAPPYTRRPLPSTRRALLLTRRTLPSTRRPVPPTHRRGLPSTCRSPPPIIRPLRPLRALHARCTAASMHDDRVYA
jgi:hypothetical protein